MCVCSYGPWKGDNTTTIHTKETYTREVGFGSLKEIINESTCVLFVY